MANYISHLTKKYRLYKRLRNYPVKPKCCYFSVYKFLQLSTTLLKSHVHDNFGIYII
jgi:hypothetical protein